MPGGAFLTGGSSLADLRRRRRWQPTRTSSWSASTTGSASSASAGSVRRSATATVGLRDQLAAAVLGEAQHQRVRRRSRCGDGDGGVRRCRRAAAPALVASVSVGVIDRYILRSPGVDHTLYPDDVETRQHALCCGSFRCRRATSGSVRELDGAALLEGAGGSRPGDDAGDLLDAVPSLHRRQAAVGQLRPRPSPTASDGRRI